MEDRNNSRCKACDRLFNPRWLPQAKAFEELCHVCLPIALRTDDNDDDSDFLAGYLMDKIKDRDYGAD